MHLNFEPISVGRQEEYHSRLLDVPQLSSDYSFVNLWAWAEEYGLSWAWHDDLVWIRQTEPVKAYWAPVGAWGRIDWRSRLTALDEKYPFQRVPEKLAAIWRDFEFFGFNNSRAHWDYLFSWRDLVELKGKRFHAKKNLLNQFQSEYRSHYSRLDNNFVNAVLSMQYEWCVWRNCESSAGLAAEDRVISKVLNAYSSFPNLLGGALSINGDIVAYTVAELLCPQTLVIHFEKAMGGYKGVYQAINREFLSAQTGIKIVNREQDLGSEGLRKAKLSYNPIGFIKKYEFFWR